MVVFAVLYTLPKFFELRLERVAIPRAGASNATTAATDLNATATFEDEAEEDPVEYRTDLRPTAMRKNKVYIVLYLIWLNLFVQVRIARRLFVHHFTNFFRHPDRHPLRGADPPQLQDIQHHPSV